MFSSAEVQTEDNTMDGWPAAVEADLRTCRRCRAFIPAAVVLVDQAGVMVVVIASFSKINVCFLSIKREGVR